MVVVLLTAVVVLLVTIVVVTVVNGQQSAKKPVSETALLFRNFFAHSESSCAVDIYRKSKRPTFVAAEDESGVTVNYLGILTLTGVKHWRKNSASDFH